MNNQNELISAILAKDKLERYRTNHILHIILSILTGGLWLGIYLFMTIHNASKRSEIERRIKKLVRHGLAYGVGPSRLKALAESKLHNFGDQQ